MVWTLTQVAFGGAVGAALRFLAVSLIGTPGATLIVNVVGSFLIGAAYVALSPRLSPLLVTGVLGGFTTFSAFALDTLRLAEAGQAAQAALYVGASVLLSLGAVASGAALARAALG